VTSSGERVLLAPWVGDTYQDKSDPKRTLKVEEVVPSDPAGRDVRGHLSYEGTFYHSRHYATDAKTFDANWEEQ